MFRLIIVLCLAQRTFSAPAILSSNQVGRGGPTRPYGGSITLHVELRSDGSVGEIKVLQGLSSGLDENAADAARKTIFLPAVKNREVVNAHVRLMMNFNIY